MILAALTPLLSFALFPLSAQAQSGSSSATLKFRPTAKRSSPMASPFCSWKSTICLW